MIRVLDWNTYDGWAWLEGYQLNTAGEAVERREIFVQLNGLQSAVSRRDQATAIAPHPQASTVVSRDQASAVAR